MPAALLLPAEDEDVVGSYLAAMRAVGRKTGTSTTQAARTCQARISRAGGWAALTPAQRIDAAAKARSFTSWLMVTGQLVVDAELVSLLTLHLGSAARSYCPHDHAWFTAAAAPLSLADNEIRAQWNLLAKITALTGTPPALGSGE